MGSPSLANPLAGAFVHWTKALIRLALHGPPIDQQKTMGSTSKKGVCVPSLQDAGMEATLRATQKIELRNASNKRYFHEECERAPTPFFQTLISSVNFFFAMRLP
jgi:hypothetical protein